MTRVNMSWYTATPHTLLQAAPLRFAIRKHMGLPVFHPGQRCQYTPLTTGRRCHQQLGPYSDHSLTCAQGPSIRRHNRIRDAWISLFRKSSWQTTAEQLVYTGEGETKRADFVAHTPDGARIACDVMVTASPTPWESHDTHLQRSAAAKATRYATVPGGFTHDRAQLWPLVHDAHNFWLDRDAARLLHRLLSVQARQAAPALSDQWSAHFSLASVEASAPLMQAAVLSSWQLHAACGRLL